MLQSHASEEAAKALILMDAIRCPKKLIGSQMGKLSKWWYSHLARLIYADAVHWRVNNVRELRDAVDSLRKLYDRDYTEAYLDDMPEPHMAQNSYLYERESILYTDIERSNEGKFIWSDPSHTGHTLMLLSQHFNKPGPLQLVEAMYAVGIFKFPGINATAEIWGTKNFTDDSGSRDDNNELIRQLLFRLDDEEITDEEELERYLAANGPNPENVLYELWQLPMYNLELATIRSNDA